MNCTAAVWSLLDLPDDRPVLSPDLGEATLVAQVDRLLDQLPARFELVGLSLGGIVAMALTRTAPERVASLVLMSTNAYPPTPAQLLFWQRSREALHAGRTAADLQDAWIPLLLSEGGRRQPDLVNLTLGMAVPEVQLEAQLRLQSTRADERTSLSRISCPTTIISARLDGLCSVGKHVEMQRLIPGSQLQVIDSCGHLSPLEQPIRVAAALALHGLADR